MIHCEVDLQTFTAKHQNLTIKTLACKVSLIFSKQYYLSEYASH